MSSSPPSKKQDTAARVQRDFLDRPCDAKAANSELLLKDGWASRAFNTGAALRNVRLKPPTPGFIESRTAK
jgi:hypothetical protein